MVVVKVANMAVIRITVAIVTIPMVVAAVVAVR